jgi:hypothetical protein
LSTNVNEIKNKQAQIGTELANRTLVYYISASIKIVLNVEQTSACFVVNMNLINSTEIIYDEH